MLAQSPGVPIRAARPAASSLGSFYARSRADRERVRSIGIPANPRAIAGRRHLFLDCAVLRRDGAWRVRRGMLLTPVHTAPALPRAPSCVFRRSDRFLTANFCSTVLSAPNPPVIQRGVAVLSTIGANCHGPGSPAAARKGAAVRIGGRRSVWQTARQMRSNPLSRANEGVPRTVTRHAGTASPCAPTACSTTSRMPGVSTATIPLLSCPATSYAGNDILCR